jgi:hypothetical protein
MRRLGFGFVNRHVFAVLHKGSPSTFSIDSSINARDSSAKNSLCLHHFSHTTFEGLRLSLRMETISTRAPMMPIGDRFGDVITDAFRLRQWQASSPLSP